MRGRAIDNRGFPAPVGKMAAALLPASRRLITASCPGRKRSKPKCRVNKEVIAARLPEKGRHHITSGPVVADDRTGLVTF